MTAAAVKLEDVLGSDAVSGDAALTEEDVIACMVDAGPHLNSLKTGPGPHTAAGAAENDEDWSFLLDALDAFEHPHSSGHSGAAGSGIDQHQKQQPSQSGQPLGQTPADATRSTTTAAAGGGGGRDAGSTRVLYQPAPSSSSPPVASKLEPQPPLQTGSVTASGEADCHSAVAAVGWGSLPDRFTTRFSWAEDNSPLLAGIGGNGDAAADLSGGNSHSPGSAGGAHSSAGPPNRIGGGGVTQPQQQAGGSSSGPWANELLPPAVMHNTVGATGTSACHRPQGMSSQQHPAAVAFSSAMSPPVPVFLGAGGSSGQEPISSSSVLTSHNQLLPQPLPLALNNSSASQQYNTTHPYRQSLDYLTEPGRPHLTGIQTHMGGSSSNQLGQQQQQQQQQAHVNQFAVPGSPLAGSPLAADTQLGFNPQFDMAGTPFVLGSVQHYGQPGGMMLQQQQPQHAGRAVVTGAQLQHGRSGGGSGGGGGGGGSSWGCPCCPPGRPHQQHSSLLPPGSGAMINCQLTPLPEPHRLSGYSTGGLNPDWRPAPHSMAMDLDMGRPLPPGVPPYHMPPQPGNRSVPMSHPMGHHPQHHGMMAPPYPSGHMQQLPMPTPGAAAAVPGGSRVAGAGSRVAGASGAGGPAAPQVVGEIHPAALSQFGFPEETFPVMVGPPKRKRGRPRKHPLPEVAAAAAAIAAARAPAPAAAGQRAGVHVPVSGPPPAAHNPASSMQPQPQPQLQHHMVLQQQQRQQQQQQLLMFQNQQRQQQHHAHQQQQQQQRRQQQHIMDDQGSVQPWSGPAQPTLLAGMGSGDMLWSGGVGGLPDSPFSPAAIVKRQKSRDVIWPLGS